MRHPKKCCISLHLVKHAVVQLDLARQLSLISKHSDLRLPALKALLGTFPPDKYTRVHRPQSTSWMRLLLFGVSWKSMLKSKAVPFLYTDPVVHPWKVESCAFKCFT